MPKVEFFPASELELTNVSFDNKMAGTPVFYSEREQVPVAMVVVKDSQGQVVHRYVIRISGAELKLSMVERSVPVRPAYEIPADQIKATAKSEPKKG